MKYPILSKYYIVLSKNLEIIDQLLKDSIHFCYNYTHNISIIHILITYTYLMSTNSYSHFRIHTWVVKNSEPPEKKTKKPILPYIGVKGRTCRLMHPDNEKCNRDSHSVKIARAINAMRHMKCSEPMSKKLARPMAKHSAGSHSFDLKSATSVVRAVRCRQTDIQGCSYLRR